MVNIKGLGRDGLRQAELCSRNIMMNNNTYYTLISNWPQPGLKMTAPSVRHRIIGDKYATGVPKVKRIKGRENISVGTWNVRALSPAVKFEELTCNEQISLEHIRVCKMRSKTFGKLSTDCEYKVYFSGEEDKQ